MRTWLFSIVWRAVTLLPVLGPCQPALAASFPSPVVPCPLPGKGSETFLTLDDVTSPIVHELQRRF